MFTTIIFIIIFAYILDMLLGDPIWLPHPIVLMGKAVSFCEPVFRRVTKNQFIAGLLFALFLIISAWGTAFVLIKISLMINHLLGIAVQIILLFFCFSARTLEKAASEVSNAFKNYGIEDARSKVSMIVGRDVKYLDETGIVKATVETVAENFVDGFLSPLFWAVLGGVPAAAAYKMINTLDSMVGYKNDKYILFGRASARIDDIANFIPARLSIIIISIAAGLISLKRGKTALITAVKEGKEHKSPNSGYPEAAFAGALKVKLGGPNYYGGMLVKKPYIGKKFNDPAKNKIKTASDLMLFASLISVIMFLSFRFLYYLI